MGRSRRNKKDNPKVPKLDSDPDFGVSPLESSSESTDENQFAEDALQDEAENKLKKRKAREELQAELMAKAFAEFDPVAARREKPNSEKNSRQSPNTASSAKSPQESFEIDLHGATVDVACRRIDGIMNRISSRGAGVWRLRVITGKGLNSGIQGGVLGREVYHYFIVTYSHLIESIDESPDRVRLGGVPIRGHFDALIRIRL